MSELVKQHFALLCELRRQYPIEIITEDQHEDPVINYKLADRRLTTRFLECLRDELAIYPPAVVKKLQLDRIILCQNLKKFDKDVTGCASMSLFPDNLAMRMLFRKNTIYLDVKYGGTVEGRVTIHHELFHAIEAHGDRFPKYLDPYWRILNEDDFKYREELGDYEENYGNRHVTGFLTDYSMDAVREDKAELFSHMMVNCADVERFGEIDKHIKAKTSRMKHLLSGFSKQFDEVFWKQRVGSSKHVPTAEYISLLVPGLRYRWRAS